MIKKLMQWLKCRLGRHNAGFATLADLGDEHYWLQAGYYCRQCGKKWIEYEQARDAVQYAYTKGKEYGALMMAVSDYMEATIARQAGDKLSQTDKKRH